MSSSLINNRSADQILNDMVSTFQAINPDINLNEASTIYILMQIFAFNSAVNVSLAQNFALSAFIATAEGDDLTNLAADNGIDRILADTATVQLNFTRLLVDTVNSYTIPASSSFSTIPDENGSFYEFKTFDTLTLSASSTSVSGLAQAVAAGAEYNVNADTIQNFISTINGIDTVTNPYPATGGTDEETDAELRERIVTTLASNGAKNTVSGYQNTLLSLGAKSAYVYSPSGTMPNYITAVVTSTTTVDTIPTASELLYWNTEINKDENRAVADVLTVVGPSTITITVSAAILEYDVTADVAVIKAAVKQAIIDYINNLAPGETVYKNNIANLLHDQNGVIDFILYTPTTNTTITSVQKAIANDSSVTIN